MWVNNYWINPENKKIDGIRRKKARRYSFLLSITANPATLMIIANILKEIAISYESRTIMTRARTRENIAEREQIKKNLELGF